MNALTAAIARLGRLVVPPPPPTDALRQQQREASIRAAKRRYPEIRYGVRVGQSRRRSS